MQPAKAWVDELVMVLTSRGTGTYTEYKSCRLEMAQELVLKPRLRTICKNASLVCTHSKIKGTLTHLWNH